MHQELLVFGHRFCPQVHTVCAILDQMGVAYTYIDIRKDEQSRQRVREINAGNESVPTLIFKDGSTLTEPSDDALYKHLDALGFRLDQPSRTERLFINIGNPMISVCGLGVVIAGIAFSSLTIVGLGILFILAPVAVRYFQRKILNR